MACLVLIGWAFDIELFKSLGPELAAMNPLTAVCFILLSTALWSLSSPNANTAGVRRARFLSLTVVVIAVSKLADIAFDWQLNLDQILFRAKLEMTDSAIVNRMAPNTAIAFLLLGAALWFLDSRHSHWLPLALTLIAGVLALLALVGYTYGLSTFYSVTEYFPMALPTAIAFMALTLGAVAARPKSPLMASITSNTTAGVTARRLLPVVTFVPALLGWLVLRGQRLQLFSMEAAFALFTVAVILIFFFVVWRTVRTLLGIEIARTAAEAKVQSLNDNLVTANEELEAFSYSVSHDLRAPLRAISGFSHILLDDYGAVLPEEAARYLGMVNSNAAQMGRLIEDLLAFSRSSRQSLTLQQLALAPMVQQVFEEMRRLNDEREIELVIGDLPPVKADPVLMKQVIVNLMSNAIKYTGKRDRAKIEVGAEVRNGVTVYFVKDNGVGFDMKYADKLFTVFQRLHRAEDFEGTGVGLATTQRIIRRHGGQIWADAAVGQGAIFYFTLGERVVKNGH